MQMEFGAAKLRREPKVRTNTGIGRFTTRDTYAGDYQYPLTLNRWMYVNGNPVLFTDSSGNFCLGPNNTPPCSEDNDTPGKGKSWDYSSGMRSGVGLSMDHIETTELSVWGKRMSDLLGLYQCTSGPWNDYLNQSFDLADFLQLILQYESQGLEEDGLRVIDLISEATSYHLWADFDGANANSPYCTTRICYNGVLNFMGEYVESAQARWYSSFTYTVTHEDGKVYWYYKNEEDIALYNQAAIDTPPYGWDYSMDLGNSILHPSEDWRTYESYEPYDWSNRVGKNGGTCADAIKASDEWKLSNGENSNVDPYILNVGNFYVMNAYVGQTLTPKYCEFP